MRGFRIPDDLYTAVKQKAERLDLRISQVVRSLLTQWVADDELVSPTIAGMTISTERKPEQK